MVVNKDSFWISDPTQNVVYEGTLPASRAHAKRDATQHAIPTIAQIQSDINRLAKRVSLSGAIPGDIAGQAGLHGPRLAQARRRTARLAATRLGRRPRRAAPVCHLRA